MAQIHKDGTTFLYCPPGRETVELQILAARGPLCVAPMYNHHEREVRSDLFWIYIRAHGAHLGPYFTEIPVAQRAMQKIIKQAGPHFFDQPLAWIQRQHTFREWLEKTIGKPEDLIGGEWFTPKDRTT